MPAPLFTRNWSGRSGHQGSDHNMASPAHVAGTTIARIVIADDDPLVRAAVGLLLADENSYQLLGEASDGTEAVAMARDLRPDVLLLDLNMPRKHGIEALRELSDQIPNMRSVLLTVAIERRQIIEALQLGARGIVMKADARPLLACSVQAVMRGQYWIKDRALDDIRQVMAELIAGPYLEAVPGDASAKAALLTPKEAAIVAYIVEGRTNKDIANTLQTSEQVVKNHLGKIFDKLGVFNRLELALYAIDNRLVDRR